MEVGNDGATRFVDLVRHFAQIDTCVLAFLAGQELGIAVEFRLPGGDPSVAESH